MSDETDDKKPSETESAEEEAPKAGDLAAKSTDEEPRRRARRQGREGASVEEDDDEPKPKPNYLFLIVATAIFLVLDLGTKEYAIKKLMPLKRQKPIPLPDGYEDFVVVVRNFFHLEYAENKGGAWGLLGDQADHIRLPFFFLISALAVAFIVSLYRKLEPRQIALKWALPLVLGGALGNLVDRIRHQYVVDFIDWFYITSEGKQLLAAGEAYVDVVANHKLSNHWPTFNIADVWIVAGVGLMFVDMFTPRKRVRKAPVRTEVDKTEQEVESA